MIGNTLLMQFVLVVGQAIALPMVKSSVNAWTRLYTSVAPEGERQARREEVLSDLHEHINDSKSEGYRPAEVAVQILFRMVWGAKDDVAWSTPYFSNAMATRLDSWSEDLSRMKTSRAAISLLALFSMINSVFFFSDTDKTWTHLLALNVGACVVFVVMHNQKRTWARRIINLCVAIFIIMAVAVPVWAILHLRLYEMPGFNQLFPQLAITLLPLALAMFIGSETFRARVFKGRWRPVIICWIIIAAISLGIAFSMGYSTLGIIWAGVGLATLTLVIVCVFFVAVAVVACYGALKASAGFTRLIASGIRRLT